MNKRIKELVKEAGLDDPMCPIDEYDNTELEKFAELIVRECADITSGLSKLYPRTDVAFDLSLIHI